MDIRTETSDSRYEEMTHHVNLSAITPLIFELKLFSD